MGHEVGVDEISRLVVKGQAAMPSRTGKIDHGETMDPVPFFRGQLVQTLARRIQGSRIGSGSDVKDSNDRARKENGNKPDQHETNLYFASSHAASMDEFESPANPQMRRGRKQVTPLL